MIDHPDLCFTMEAAVATAESDAIKQSREKGGLASIEVRNEGWMLRKMMATLHLDRKNIDSHESD